MEKAEKPRPLGFPCLRQRRTVQATEPFFFFVGKKTSRRCGLLSKPVPLADSWDPRDSLPTFSGSLMSPKLTIMAAFFLQPIAFGSWLPQIPGVQERLSLGPAELAMALLGLPTGILLMLPFAGQLVGRIGSRNTLIFGFPVFLVLVPLPVAAPGLASLFFLLVLLGIGLSTIELGLNVEADVIEKRGMASIMNRCHGFWSLGIMTGSLIGAGFLALQTSPFMAICLLSLFLSRFQ